MAVPFRRKPGGKEIGVKKPLNFFERTKNERIVATCKYCNEKKILHYLCKKCVTNKINNR
jgi:ribosomal protein L32